MRLPWNNARGVFRESTCKKIPDERHLSVKSDIPGDISVVICGDTLDYNLPTTPQFTTMQVATKVMGKLSADLLLERLEKESEGVRVLKTNPLLKERKSCQRLNKEKT